MIATNKPMPRVLGIGLMSLLMTLTIGPARAADPLADLPYRLTGGTPNLDLRLRHEYVHVEDPLATPIVNNDANAVTVRVRLGYTTAAWNGLDAQLEYEGVDNIGDDRYNSFNNGRSAYTVIADAQVHEVNQAWLRYSGLPKTQIKYGRQRILIDNQRFVGNVGWRQDEMTFDGALLTSTYIPKTTFTYAHLDQVNSFRYFSIGGRNTDRIDIDGHIINASYAAIGSALKLTGYGYLFDFGLQPTGAAGRLLASTQTYGLRATGTLPAKPLTLSYALEYAKQLDYTGNPVNSDSRYWLIEGTAVWKKLKGIAGYEVLGGDGRTSFQTPLGTAHAFQGWADQFLITPVNGLTRAYLSAGVTVAKLGLTAVLHDFNAERGGQHYGSEVDFLASYPLFENCVLNAKFAAYFADKAPAVAGSAIDSQKTWLYLEYKF